MIKDDWKIPYSFPDIPEELLKSGFNPLLSAVLSLRGITSLEEAEQMVGDEPCLYDPFLMQGMEAGVERLRAAVMRGERVAVYGDYDVDGITATCLLTDYITSLGIECIHYIPDRSEEGYGINRKALDQLAESGVNLVISVDCGITAIEETEYARSLGIDIIITDHHECKDNGQLPQAIAVIDPKQSGNVYPNSVLAGVGVALKFACAYEGSSESILERYCDLVAIGTVADVMPLKGENRYLVKRGLKMLEESPRPGIKAMFNESSKEPIKISSTAIGFNLAPRLNAAGRLGRAVTAADLVMTTDINEAVELSRMLCDLNKERQEIESDIWKEANEMLSKSKPDAPIVLASAEWHQGVIGIAASRLAEHYSLPTIMVCLNGDVGKGSCRSFGGFNLFEALSACSEHLIGFGGHALAAGLNIEKNKLDDFRQALTEYYRRNCPEPQPVVTCDLLITDPNMLNIENVSSLDLLEPYGNSNPKPNMCICDAVLESATAVGGGKHLRMRVSLHGVQFDGIFFSHTAKELGLRVGDRIDIAFNPQLNHFRGSVTVQLMVNAIRKHVAAPLCEHILNGEKSAYYAAAVYCPCRNDFVKVWRYINHHGFVTASDVESIIAQRPDDISPEQWCICLMVFLEVGLLVSDDGSIFNAHCSAINGKADLENTELIKALR